MSHTEILPDDRALRDSLNRMVRGTGLTIKDLYEEMRLADPSFREQILPVLFRHDAPVEGIDLKPALRRLLLLALSKSKADLRSEALIVSAQRHPVTFRVVEMDVAIELYGKRYTEEELVKNYLRNTEVEFKGLVWELETPPPPVEPAEVERFLDEKGLPNLLALFLSSLESRPIPASLQELWQLMIHDEIIQGAIRWCVQHGKASMHCFGVNLKPAFMRMLVITLEHGNLRLQDIVGLLRGVEPHSEEELLRAYSIEMEKRFKETYLADALDRSRSLALTSDELTGSTIAEMEGEIEKQRFREKERDNFWSTLVGEAVQGIISAEQVPGRISDEIQRVELELQKLKRRRGMLVTTMAHLEAEARSRWLFRTPYDSDYTTFFGGLTRGDYSVELNKVENQIIEIESYIKRLKTKDLEQVYSELGLSSAARLEKEQLADLREKAKIIRDMMGPHGESSDRERFAAHRSKRLRDIEHEIFEEFELPFTKEVERRESYKRLRRRIYQNPDLTEDQKDYLLDRLEKRLSELLGSADLSIFED